MRKELYYCDCCKQQVKREKDLTRVEITFGAEKGIMSKEVCFVCWEVYTNKIGEIAQELFYNKY